MSPDELKEGIDFYFNESGLMVLTGAYLLKRGYCCQNGCQHCPYEEKNAMDQKGVKPNKN